MVEISRRGFIIVLSSPSGAGKTTLTRKLLESDASLALSISVTTRQRRPNEVDGVHYHFIPQARFDEMVAAGELLEYASVFGNSYGTPRAPVERELAAGRVIVSDLDWQGMQQLGQSRLAADLVSIFILPPSMAELRARLDRRAEDSAATIDKRLANAKREIERWRQYDYVVVNDDLQRAYAQVVAIIGAERARCGRVAAGVEGFVDELLKG